MAAMTAVAFTSCEKTPQGGSDDNGGDGPGPDPTPEKVKLEITAKSGSFFEFKPSDAIKVFSEPEEISKRLRTSEGGADAVFTANLDEALKQESYKWYAIYPYNEAVTAPDSYTEEGSFNIGTGCEQHGINSKGHIYGKNAPMFAATASPVAKDGQIELEFQDVAAYVQIDVKNATEESIRIEKIALTAKDAIVGKYYIKFKDAVELVAVDDQTSSTAELDVLQGKIAAGETASFYLPVVPFTAKAGEELLVSVNGISKKAGNAQDLAFEAGKTTVVKYEINAIGNFGFTEVDARDDKTIALSWTAAENAERYVVSYKENGESKTIDNGTQTSATLENLAHGFYTVTVTAEAEGCASKSISTETIVLGEEFNRENLVYTLLTAEGTVYENEVYYPDSERDGYKPVKDNFESDGRCERRFQDGCELAIKVNGAWVKLSDAAATLGAPLDYITPEYSRSWKAYGRDRDPGDMGGLRDPYDSWSNPARSEENSEMGGPFIVTEGNPYGFTVKIGDEPIDCDRHLNYLNRYLVMKGKWGFNLGKEDEKIVFATEDIEDLFWFMGDEFYEKYDNSIETNHYWGKPYEGK